MFEYVGIAFVVHILISCKSVFNWSLEKLNHSPLILHAAYCLCNSLFKLRMIYGVPNGNYFDLEREEDTKFATRMAARDDLPILNQLKRA